MDISVHKFMNMYLHVCTMFKHIYTVLQYPVHVGRIPDIDSTYCFDILVQYSISLIYEGYILSTY